MGSRGAVLAADLGRSSDDSNGRKLLSAALKAEEENDPVGTAVGHGLAGPKTPAMSRRIAGESGFSSVGALIGSNRVGIPERHGLRRKYPRGRRGKMAQIPSPEIASRMASSGNADLTRSTWFSPRIP